MEICNTCGQKIIKKEDRRFGSRTKAQRAGNSKNWETRRKNIDRECTKENHAKKVKSGMRYCNLCVRRLI